MIEKEALSQLGGNRVPCFPSPSRWEHQISRSDWYAHLREQVRGAVSVYVHIPFCESLCSFCGCNTSITRDKSWSSRYTDWLLNEWRHYQEAVPQLADIAISDVRFGGGTPQFLLTEDFERLFNGLLSGRSLDGNPSVAVEIDPRVSTSEQLQRFIELGVTDFEIGIQDLEPRVQRQIHRYQSLEQVQLVMRTLKSSTRPVRIGWELVYGLPGQTSESWKKTLLETRAADPDRIQVYPFFSLPWLKRLNSESDESVLMSTEQKEILSQRAYQFFLSEGYRDLGEGLFTRQEDPLARAFQMGRLHRHFSGLCVQTSSALIGIGAGAISETAVMNYQNVKALPVYQRLSERREDLGQRAHRLNDRELFFKMIIREAQTRHALSANLVRAILEWEPSWRGLFSESEGDETYWAFRSPAHVGLFLHRFLQLNTERAEQIRKEVDAG